MAYSALFYVCAPSITDQTVAPENNENLFFLIPIAPDLKDNEEIRNQYFDLIIDRFEKRTGNNIKSDIIYKRSYCISDFKSDYNAFKGNAYGLANTLKQTAIFKPSLKNKKINNMYYSTIDRSRARSSSINNIRRGSCQTNHKRF